MTKTKSQRERAKIAKQKGVSISAIPPRSAGKATKVVVRETRLVRPTRVDEPKSSRSRSKKPENRMLVSQPTSAKNAPVMRLKGPMQNDRKSNRAPRGSISTGARLIRENTRESIAVAESIIRSMTDPTIMPSRIGFGQTRSTLVQTSAATYHAPIALTYSGMSGLVFDLWAFPTIGTASGLCRLNGAPVDSSTNFANTQYTALQVSQGPTIAAVANYGRIINTILEYEIVQPNTAPLPYISIMGFNANNMTVNQALSSTNADNLLYQTYGNRLFTGQKYMSGRVASTPLDKVCFTPSAAIGVGSSVNSAFTIPRVSIMWPNYSTATGIMIRANMFVVIEFTLPNSNYNLGSFDNVADVADVDADTVSEVVIENFETARKIATGIGVVLRFGFGLSGVTTAAMAASSLLGKTNDEADPPYVGPPGDVPCQPPLSDPVKALQEKVKELEQAVSSGCSANRNNENDENEDAEDLSTLDLANLPHDEAQLPSRGLAQQLKLVFRPSVDSSAKVKRSASSK